MDLIKITVLKHTISYREKNFSPLDRASYVHFQQTAGNTNIDQVEKTHEKLYLSSYKDTKAMNNFLSLFLTRMTQFSVKFNSALNSTD